MPITIEQADAVSKPYFDENFVENVYNQSAFLKLLKANKRMIPGGTEARWPINYRRLGTTQARGPRDQISFESRDTRTAVKTDPAYYDTTQMMWKDERVQNVGNQQIIRLVREKADEMQEDLAWQMGTDLFTKNKSGKGFTPLSDLISNAAYGGVNEDVYKSRQQVGGAIKMYGTGDGDVSNELDRALFGMYHCDTVILSPELHTKIEEIWVDKGARFQMAQSQKMIDLGLKTFNFRGVDFVVDQFLSATTALQQTMYGTEMKALICYEHSEGTSTGEWLDATVMGYPSALARVAEWTGQLHIVRRRTSFRTTGITQVTFNN